MLKAFQSLLKPLPSCLLILSNLNIKVEYSSELVLPKSDGGWIWHLKFPILSKQTIFLEQFLDPGSVQGIY